MATFLFDIGRVLLDFDFETSLARLLPTECTDVYARLSRLLERKDEFESGAISPEEYTTWALEVIGSQSTPEEFHHAWRDIFTPNEPMWECVRELSAAGHRLILFSNTNVLHCPWMFETFPEFSLFHEAVISCEVGHVKPFPGIYQHALETFDLEPFETFYIDDLAENIDAGRAFGFHCHQYDLKNHAAFTCWLASRNVGVPGERRHLGGSKSVPLAALNMRPEAGEFSKKRQDATLCRQDAGAPHLAANPPTLLDS